MLKSEQKEEQKKEKAKLKKKEKKKKRNKLAKTPQSPSRATTPVTMPARSTHEAAFNCTFDYLATAIERTQNEVHSQLTDRSIPSFTKQSAPGDWLEVRSK